MSDLVNPSICLALLVAGLLMTIGCSDGGDGQIAEISTAVIPVEQVTASVRVDYGNFDGPPIWAEVGRVIPAPNGWVAHRLTLGGAQMEWNTAIAVDGSDFFVRDGLFVAEDADPMRRRLHREDSISFNLEVGEAGVGLPVGEHAYDLVVPVWLDSEAAFAGRAADGEVVVELKYTIHDPNAGPPVFRNGGLECLTDLSESGTSDYEDGAEGAPKQSEAVDDWWRSGNTYLERDELTEEVSGLRYSYEDDAGRVQLIFTVTRLGDGWAVQSYESCSDMWSS